MLLKTVFCALATLLSTAHATSRGSWSFEDATLTVQSKGAGVGAGLKEKLSPSTPLKNAITLGTSDTLKITLTTTEEKKAKRPHQAFLTLREPATGLEESYTFSVKDSAKGKLDLTSKDLPIQHLTASQPLQAFIVVASFGYSTPLKTQVFDLSIDRDQNTPIQIPPAPLRYGKLEEIHHIFRSDPKTPPRIITAVFVCMVFVTLPVLAGTWMTIGMNFNHMPEAVGSAPIAYALFVGSIFALEGLFFLYYLGWTLFKTLPAVAAVGSITFLSGSRALSEVQERRLAGKR